MTARIAGCPRAGRPVRAATRGAIWALIAVLALLGGAPAFAQAARKHVALAEVTNGSYYNGPDVASDARAALLTAMLDSENLETVADDSVRQKIQELELESPFTETELRQLGEALGADLVVSGRVLACSVNDYSHTASTRLRVTIFDAAAGATVRTAMVRGKGEAGKDPRATDEDLIAAALKDAAYQAVLEINQNLTISATIIAAMDKDRVLVSLPQDSGAQIGTELAAYRGTTEIARLVIYSVTPGHSVAKLKTNTPLNELQAGMRVLVVSTPSASLEEADVRPPKHKKSNAWKIAAAVLVGAAVVYAVVRSVSGNSGGATTGFFRTPVANQEIQGGVDTPVEVVFSRRDGTPVPNYTEVNFSLQQAAPVRTEQTPVLGSIQSPVRTSGGIAQTTFIPGDAGTRVRLVARVGGFSVSRDVQIGSGLPSQLILEVPDDQRVIQANGLNSAQITATVTDTNGNPVIDGTMVSFETTAGALDRSQAPTVNGQAQVLLLSPTTSGPVTVTATVDGEGGPIVRQVSITVAPEDPAAITLSIESTSVATGSTVRLQAIVNDRFGNPVEDGTGVTFRVDPDPTVGSFNPAGTLSTVRGRVETQFTAGGTPATATIVARAGMAIAQLPITISGTTAVRIQFVRFDPPERSAAADGLDYVSAVCRVYAHAINNVPVADGTPITFTVDGGATIYSQPGIVQAGEAEARVTSTTPGPATLTATSGTITATAQLTFEQLAPSRIQVTVADNPISIGADGVAQTDVMATVTDANGSLVQDGTTVFFTTDLGTIVSSAVTTDGIVTVPFSSIVTGTATVEVSAGDLEPVAVSITVSAGAPAAVVLSANPFAIRADGNSFSTVSARVVDPSGNAVVDGTEVAFTALLYHVPGAGGDETEPTTITQTARTVRGTATAILVSRNPLTNEPNRPGTARVTANVVGTTATNAITEVQYVSQVAASIALGASVVNVRGLDVVGNETTLTTLVRDEFNNPVPDNTAVYFWSSKGMVRGTRGTVNGVAESYTQNGIAMAALLTAGTIDDPGPAWDGWVDIKVSSGPVEERFADAVLFSGPASTTLETGGAASFLMVGGTRWDVTGGPAVLPTMGSLGDGMDVVINAKDKKGNPVADGTGVNLQADKGRLSAPSLTTLGGVASTRIFSPEEGNPVPVGLGRLVVLISTTTGSALQLDANYQVVP